MAFRSGYHRFRTQAPLLRKSTFLLNGETNSRARQGLKKKEKCSYRKTNKYSAQFQEVSRGSNKPLALEVVGEHLCLLQPRFLFMLLAFIQPPQEGIPTSGYSQSIFGKGRLEIPPPAWGRGSPQIWIGFHTAAGLEARLPQNPERGFPQREGEKDFSRCEHACEENAFSRGWNQETEGLFVEP